jgi:ferrochelatase
MARFIGSPDYKHKTTPKIGILLTNLGTPDAPTAPALRRYLKQFLSDPRVVEIPRVVWLAILHGIILRVRPKKSAATYATVWQPEGSPLLTISQQQTSAFRETLTAKLSEASDAPPQIEVALGMRYGNPSIDSGLMTLKKSHCEAILVLPLYPQYSGATTGSTFDALSESLRKWRWVPDLHFVNHYHDDPKFIEACVHQIKTFWLNHDRPERLIFSYHGVPKKYLLSGDPYHCHCHKTTRLISELLDYPAENIMTTFQSRFGKAEWLKPYTDHTLKALGQQGIKHVQVFCPGFSADCLETLEEIAEENKEYFMESGGTDYHYITALNDTPKHIDALVELALARMSAWVKQKQRDTALCRTEAEKLGGK